MNKDEEYVRSVWERQMTWAQITPEAGVINGFSEIYDGPVHKFPQPESAAWSAAAEFTRARLEQVRQLREEIRFVCEADYSGSDGEVTEQAEAAQKRTVARLESALATLTQGMKPDVQP